MLQRCLQSAVCFVCARPSFYVSLTLQFFPNVYLKLFAPSIHFKVNKKKKMFAYGFVHNFCSLAPSFPSCCQNRNLALTHHQFRSPNSILKLKKQPFLSNSHFKFSRSQKPRSTFVVFAAQSNIYKVLQNAWRVGRDGIEAGTNLIPNSVPRPIARISVTFVALSVSLFVFKSLLSTAFFILATIGLAYFAYLAFNKDQGPNGNGNGGTTSSPPMDDPVEEAKKIMDKYK